MSIVKFTIPNGRKWLVELRKYEKKFWFDIGWHEFVERCSIHAGYFLIFRYQGNSNFNVYIFDLATSEIEYPCNILEEPSSSKQCAVPFEKDKEENNSLRILPPLSSPCPVILSPTIKVFDEVPLPKWNKDSFFSGVKLEVLHLPEDVNNQEATFQFPQDKGIQLKSKFTNTIDEVGMYFSRGMKRKISGHGQINFSCKLFILAVFF